MNRRENSRLMVARPNRQLSYIDINIRRKASRIANTAIVNNCNSVKISKGKTPIITQRIIENQVEVVVPSQVPMDKLAFHIESRLRGRKNIKIEIAGYEKPRRKRNESELKTRKKIRPTLKSNKGDGDDGSGTSGRHGRIRRKK